jgi:hypothetical protein
MGNEYKKDSVNRSMNMMSNDIYFGNYVYATFMVCWNNIGYISLEKVEL